jgi:hypothetical protein
MEFQRVESKSCSERKFNRNLTVNVSIYINYIESKGEFHDEKNV